MENAKVLFISQEITPYLPETEMSVISRNLPQGIQERGREIRTFMPKYGVINERRNQLHEVIRLSGMNLIINDADHPLIIKVASIQSARMQVYFIDNDDYFNRKSIMTDEHDIYFPDNDERALFFAKGVLETVKKLRWSPDIIHCHGWFTSFVPLYIKSVYFDNPLFANSKVVFSVYDNEFRGAFHKQIRNKLAFDGIENKTLDIIKTPNYSSLTKLAINHSDAVILASPKINPEVSEYLSKLKKPILPHQPQETFIDAYCDFYDKLLEP